jgi:hypothetical protein
MSKNVVPMPRALAPLAAAFIMLAATGVAFAQAPAVGFSSSQFNGMKPGQGVAVRSSAGTKTGAREGVDPTSAPFLNTIHPIIYKSGRDHKSDRCLKSGRCRPVRLLEY